MAASGGATGAASGVAVVTTAASTGAPVTAPAASGFGAVALSVVALPPANTTAATMPPMTTTAKPANNPTRERGAADGTVAGPAWPAAVLSVVGLPSTCVA